MCCVVQSSIKGGAHMCCVGVSGTRAPSQHVLVLPLTEVLRYSALNVVMQSKYEYAM